jgi:heme exporter protein C
MGRVLHARYPNWALPVLLVALFAIAMFMAFIASPPDVVLGDTVRIFYIHVSVAWTALVAFTVNFVGSVLYLVRRDPAVDRWAGASAEIGAMFTTATLFTGSIWARVAWGVWWTWDPRLTTALVMWFVYIAYLIVRMNLSDPGRRAQVSSVIGIVAFADVPLVYFSVDIWRSIHPIVVGPNGNFNMAPLMMWAMFSMLAAVSVLYLAILSLRVRQERVADTLRLLGMRVQA